MDFNAKKEILRKLQKKGAENLFMRVLCAIAAVFVKIWYGIGCRISMIFSDRNGNLFGIKSLGSKSGERKKARRQDDIVYVKKPFFGRILSAVLAFSFIFMVAPELGFDLTVLAVDMSIGYEVNYNGETLVFYRDTGRPSGNYLYRADHYETASTTEMISNIRYEAAYGSVYVTWDYRGLDATTYRLKEFVVELFSSAGDSLGKQTRNASQQNALFENIGTGTVYAVVYPRIGIQSWLYEGSLVAGEGSAEQNTGRLQPLTSSSDDFVFDGMKFGDDAKSYVTTNARFDASALDLNVNEVKSIDLYTNEITLEWTAVTQEGGEGSIDVTSIPNSPEGYYIYWQTGGSGDYTLLSTASRNSTSLTFTVPYGNYYKFFIEAYRSNNAGVISSSLASYNDSATAKAGSAIYSKEIVTVYVAPSQPSMNVEANENSYTIEITDIKPGAGSSYSGVYLFRSEGEIPKSSTDANIAPLLDENKNFGKFLLERCSNKGNEFGIDPVKNNRLVAAGNSTTLTYTDRDIIEGVTYWYYAVAFITKNNSDVELYSIGVARGSAMLDLGLKRPIITNTSQEDGQTVITWDAVSGAQYYEIEITKLGCWYGDDCWQDEEGKPIVEVFDVPRGTSYTHTRLYNNDTYQYRVRAYIDIKSQNDDGTIETQYCGDWSNPVTVVIGDSEFLPPQDVNASTKDGEITVTWDRVAKATGYTLYYTNLTTGESDKFDGLTVLTKKHTNLINEQRYTYWVVAYKRISGDGHHGVQRVDSEESNHVTLKVGEDLNIPQDLKVTTKDGETTVTWASVSGAQGYILEYRKLPSQNWDFDPSTNKGTDSRSIDLARTTYNHTMLQNGDVYEYRVRAYKTVSGERVYSDTSVTVSITVGDVLDTPRDFAVTTTDGRANLKWTAVKNAEGYIVYARKSGESSSEMYDVSKVTFDHTNLINGDVWTYYVVAYKTVNGSRTYSKPTQSITITVGVSMAAAVDLTAVPGNRQVVLTWTAVTGAEGYVVYLYNEDTMEYDPIAVTSKPTYTHLGLKNGKGYTYMVAAFKTTNGTRVYGEYSMPVTAVPTNGSLTDIDRDLTIKGTAPYGISHGEYISAGANHAAFDESVDVYFTTSEEATNAVRDVLKNYAEGLSSFIIYPFDISIYKENTFIEVSPNRGYSVTITMPIPDRLIAYRDYITVVHINENADAEYITDVDWFDYTDRRLEVLPAAILDIDNIWCLQFECTSFSPYAIVIYKEHITDISSGGGVMDGIFAGNFNSGVLLFTTLPDILPNNRKLKIVSGGKKRYRIKNVEKRDM